MFDVNRIKDKSFKAFDMKDIGATNPIFFIARHRDKKIVTFVMTYKYVECGICKYPLWFLCQAFLNVTS